MAVHRAYSSSVTTSNGTVVEDYWEVNEPCIGTAANADRKNAYVRAQYRTLPGGRSTSASQFDYDKNGNLTSKKEFGWLTAVPRTGDVVSDGFLL